MSLLEGLAYATGNQRNSAAEFDRITGIRKQNGLAKLAGDYAAGGDPNYQAWAANGGDPMALKGNEDQKLGQDIQAFLANPDPMAYQQSLAPRLKQRFPSAGAGADNFDPSHMEGLQNISNMLLGGKSAQGVGVQSTYVDEQGNRVGIMRDGSTRILGKNAPNNQIMEANGGFFGVNKSNLQAAPVTMGQAPQQAPQPGNNDSIIAAANFMRESGVPPERIDAWLSKQPGMMPPDASQQPPVGQQFGGQLQAAPKAPAAPSPETFSQPQTVLGPDGKPRLVQFGNQGGQRVPEGVAPAPSASDSRSSATALRQVNAAKAKLIDLKSVKAQLALVQEKFAPLKNSASAGPFGQGYLPTESGRRYDAAVSLLQQQVRKLTRTPGEGSMSDWEGKLAMLANPDRKDYEAVTQDKIDQLTALVNQIEQGYTAIMDDNSGGATQAPPAASGGAGSVIKYDAQGNRIK